MSVRRAFVLVELDFLEGMEYVGSEFYCTQPGDTPSNQVYDARLEDVVYERSISCKIWTGSNRPPNPVRELRFVNSDGGISDWTEKTIRDRYVTVRVAYASGNQAALSWYEIPYDDFVVVGNLQGDQVIADGEDSIRVTLRSWIDVLGELPYSVGVLPSTIGEVQFMRPKVIFESGRQYATCDTPYQEAVLEVRMSGTPLVAGGVDYTEDSTGFVMVSAPTGVLQCQVQGQQFTAGAYFEYPEDCIAYAIDERVGLAGITHSSLSSLPAYKMATCIYDAMNCAEFVQNILDSINGFWWQAQDGLLRFGVLAAPSGTPVLEIVEDDLDGDLQVDPDLAPGLTQTVYYNLNYAVARDEEVANYASASDRVIAKREYDFVTTTTPPDGKYSAAVTRDPRRLWIGDDIAAAQAVVDDSCGIYAGNNAYFGRLSVFVPDGVSAANTLEPNDVVQITHSRYGLSGGVLARVVSASSSIFSQRLELILWWVIGPAVQSGTGESFAWGDGTKVEWSA